MRPIPARGPGYPPLSRTRPPSTGPPSSHGRIPLKKERTLHLPRLLEKKTNTIMLSCSLPLIYLIIYNVHWCSCLVKHANSVLLLHLQRVVFSLPGQSPPLVWTPVPLLHQVLSRWVPFPRCRLSLEQFPPRKVSTSPSRLVPCTTHPYHLSALLGEHHTYVYRNSQYFHW